MQILTLDNTCYKLRNLPDELEEEIHFSVLDNSDPKNPDFFFIPMIFVESFSAPAIVMEINGKEIMVPVDWCMAVGDSYSGNDLEILPLTVLMTEALKRFYLIQYLVLNLTLAKLKLLISIMMLNGIFLK